jgi:16S rRNA (adenine1518-N6/adenine1519-N6)-dimethyltransferase
MKPRAKKRYGQHFLEAVWADRVVQAIAPEPHDRFVEIGSGPGILTVRLARKVAHLTAVEIDPDMVAALTPNVPANVTIAPEDFLDFDLDRVGRTGPLRIAGNLPYNAATPILLKLLDARRRGLELVDASVMIQREVADRIEAEPGTKDYGPLSIVVQLRASAFTIAHAAARGFSSAAKGSFRCRSTDLPRSADRDEGRGDLSCDGPIDLYAAAENALECLAGVCRNSGDCRARCALARRAGRQPAT